ncbi:hypothetical protein [Paraburkholderia sp. DGU8]|uniref:hypothetical protein n=1 Tax=Paraburkholderia sp. DGU8 TaxID=3161997 RepID=UPI003466C5CC
MTIRLACASTLTALGLACSSTAFARVVVYVPAAMVYAPPPRPVYCCLPLNVAYVTAPPPVAAPAAVAAAVSVTVAPIKPAALDTNVVGPPPNYAPAPVVTYAQPVIAIPR